jgi:hypothetical protein
VKLLQEVVKEKEEGDNVITSKDASSDKITTSSDKSVEDKSVEDKTQPVKNDETIKWSVGHIGRGLLLSAPDFQLHLDQNAVILMLGHILTKQDVDITDVKGKNVSVEYKDGDIVFKRQSDDTYPEGIVLPSKIVKDLQREWSHDLEVVEDDTPSINESAGHPLDDSLEDDSGERILQMDENSLWSIKQDFSGVVLEMTRDGLTYCNTHHHVPNNLPSTVKGDVFLWKLSLNTLKGCPKKVTGRFDIGHNQLSSFDDMPRVIGGEFCQRKCGVTSLQHIADKCDAMESIRLDVTNTDIIGLLMIKWPPFIEAGSFFSAHTQFAHLWNSKVKAIRANRLKNHEAIMQLLVECEDEHIIGLFGDI